MHKPSELHSFLNSLGVHPKKSLGQNFLIEKNIIQKILQVAEISSGDLVLEIGPGPGALTEALLEKGAKVIAVEKDEIFAKALKTRLQNHPLEVHPEDILNFSPKNSLKEKAKIVANLPYQITSPILAKFLPLYSLFTSMTVMVQEEVAQRITAKPGTRAWNSLALLSNYHSAPEYSFRVGKNLFYPAPKVDSAVVHMPLQPPRPISDEKRFFLMTRSAFQQRRKMIRSSLKKLYASQMIEQALHEIDRSPKTRPEELSLEQFIALFEKLEAKSKEQKA